MLSEGFDIFTLKLNPIMLLVTKKGAISDIAKYFFLFFFSVKLPALGNEKPAGSHRLPETTHVCHKCVQRRETTAVICNL